MDIKPLAHSSYALPLAAAVPVRPAADNAPQAEEAEGPAEISQGVREAAKAQNQDQAVREEDRTQAAEERRVVAELAARDREVRTHEQAHQSAAGPYFRGINFTYEKGPDGNAYAVAGQVRIDTRPVPNDPQATLRKMETVQRAALAPVDPSPQDHKVAAQAAVQANRARLELLARDTDPAASTNRIDAFA